MQYLGRVIKVSVKVVKILKKRANRALVLRGAVAIQLDPGNPIFGPRMRQAVQLFQTRHLDTEGQPLKADGDVVAINWAALFGPEQILSAGLTTGKFLVQVLKIAAAEEQKHVREVPKNSNRGPEVDADLKHAGVSTGLP